MIYTVVISPEARDDLVALFQWFVERAGQARALSLLEEIESLCLSLAEMPERGRKRSDIRPNMRILAHKKRFTIPYMVQNGRVTILRVFYAGQDWEHGIE